MNLAAAAKEQAARVHDGATLAPPAADGASDRKVDADRVSSNVHGKMGHKGSLPTYDRTRGGT